MRTKQATECLYFKYGLSNTRFTDNYVFKPIFLTLISTHPLDSESLQNITKGFGHGESGYSGVKPEHWKLTDSAEVLYNIIPDMVDYAIGKPGWEREYEIVPGEREITKLKRFTTDLSGAIRTLSNDKSFVKGFRRGIGLILFSWVLTNIGGCITYPLWKAFLETLR